MTNFERPSNIVKDNLNPPKEMIDFIENQDYVKSYKIKWSDEHDDFIFDYIDGTIDITRMSLTKIPFIFNEVHGSFYCSYNKLTSLEGSPKIVNKNFWCYDNNLTSLKGIGEVKGNMQCYDNLKSEEELLKEYKESLSESLYSVPKEYFKKSLNYLKYFATINVGFKGKVLNTVINYTRKHYKDYLKDGYVMITAHQYIAITNEEIK